MLAPGNVPKTRVRRASQGLPPPFTSWKTPRKEGRGCLVGKPTNGGAQTPHPRARCLHTSDSSKAFIGALYTLPYLPTDTRGVPAGAPGLRTNSGRAHPQVGAHSAQKKRRRRRAVARLGVPFSVDLVGTRSSLTKASYCLRSLLFYGPKPACVGGSRWWTARVVEDGLPFGTRHLSLFLSLSVLCSSCPIHPRLVRRRTVRRVPRPPCIAASATLPNNTRSIRLSDFFLSPPQPRPAQRTPAGFESTASRG